LTQSIYVYIYILTHNYFLLLFLYKFSEDINKQDHKIDTIIKPNKNKSKTLFALFILIP